MFVRAACKGSDLQEDWIYDEKADAFYFKKRKKKTLAKTFPNSKLEAKGEPNEDLWGTTNWSENCMSQIWSRARPLPAAVPGVAQNFEKINCNS